MDDYNDLSGEFIIKSRLSNTMTGKFMLYASDNDEVEAEIFIKIKTNSDLDSVISVRVPDDNDRNAAIDIKYGSEDSLDAFIQAISSDSLDASIEIRPHNRMFGKFELLEAPRINVDLIPIGDSTTRSRYDLQTINYGSSNSMLTGRNPTEEFESFINFGKLKNRIPDLLILESVKLRLYYIESPQQGAALELHQPSTVWQEMGITYANKPQSVELLASEYTLNTTERYIEFDVLNIAKEWEAETLLNYGFIIKTPDDKTVSFYTRESTKPPLLKVRYVTNQVYSTGREQLDSFIFIMGKKDSDLNSSINVHSDVGFERLDSTIYIHRREDPLFSEVESKITTSIPDFHSEMTIAVREEDDLDSYLSVYESRDTELVSDVSISIPDLAATINIDPNASLHSFITIVQNENTELDSDVVVSIPDQYSHITIDPNMSLPSTINIGRNEWDDLDSAITTSIPELFSHITIDPNMSLPSEITIKRSEDDDLNSIITVSLPDIDGYITIRAYGESSLDSTIDIPFYEEVESSITMSLPEINGHITVKEFSELESEIWIKESEYLDSEIDIKNVTELSGLINVKTIVEHESEVGVSTPDLPSYIMPRVIGLSDLDSIANIRKIDVSDLNSYIVITGSDNRSYWFIM